MFKEIINDPFPHTINKKIFSKKLWQEINENWPDKKFFETYADGHNRTKKCSGRFGFYIMGYSANNFFKKKGYKNKFWKNFSDFELKDNIKKNIFYFYHILEKDLKKFMIKLNYNLLLF